MVTKKIEWTLNSEATPEVIDAYIKDWKPKENSPIFIAARLAAAENAKKNARALNEICSDGPCLLDDVAGGEISYAYGFIAGIDYVARQLFSQLRK
jgi:hypothetical protein